MIPVTTSTVKEQVAMFPKLSVAVYTMVIGVASAVKVNPLGIVETRLRIPDASLAVAAVHVTLRLGVPGCTFRTISEGQTTVGGVVSTKRWRK